MDESNFQTRIRRIQNEVIRLNNSLFALEAYNRQKYPDNFLELSLDTSARAETIACRLRHLIGDYGVLSPSEPLRIAAGAQGIQIRQQEDWTQISIPRLLPKRKAAKNGEFIMAPLHYILSDYCRQHEIRKFRACSVCFVHTYDRALDLGRIRDYDNLETRNVLNLITAYFLLDDGGRYCNVYHTTALGDKDGTEIYIMPQEKFLMFLAQQQDHPLSKIQA